jgi:hypothetical protein
MCLSLGILADPLVVFTSAPSFSLSALSFGIGKAIGCLKILPDQKRPFFQALMNCASRNFFLLIFKELHEWLDRDYLTLELFRPRPLLSPRPCPPFSPFPFFSQSCALFCSHQKINPFVFKQFRSL